MENTRTVRLSCLQPTDVVCVVGTELVLDVHGCATPGADNFAVNGTAGILVRYRPLMGPQMEDSPNQWPLDSGVEVLVSMRSPSRDLRDNKMSVTYYGKKKGIAVGKAMVYFTGVVVSLDVDTSRDGMLDKSESEQSWTWGRGGKGAILLENCDKEVACFCSKGPEDINHTDLSDLSPMKLRVQGPDAFFDTHLVVLHITAAEADKVCVYHATPTAKGARLEKVLGKKDLLYPVPAPSSQMNIFYVEGLVFPDAGFSGLVPIGISLLKSSEGVPYVPLFSRYAVFRMSPWIMTPNTLKPIEVFVCSMDDNRVFLKQLKDLVRRANCKLTICPMVENREDRWMQDEMEFGYIEGPRKGFPVVLDSPRNRGLSCFPYKRILGPDFGYWTREPEDADEVNSLDSFGNLEVSPPVTVNGKGYPLGRILFGGSLPTFAGRRMNKVVRDFLYAQQVQSPVELYSDWLIVGHVDEFMSFVPAPNSKKFCLLLASPAACWQLFEEKQKEGHGDAAMFQGLEKDVPKMPINDILANKKFMAQNKYVQDCIDLNRDILKKELGLTEKDIIDLPVLFKIPEKEKRAAAFFPDMVNMIVLGKLLGIPKPFGPIINGKCCLEEKVLSLLRPLGLDCTFIDDFAAYHQKLGEVHCGTNVRREPFAFKWWNMDL